jgi:uracil-DNA glycosylase
VKTRRRCQAHVDNCMDAQNERLQKHISELKSCRLCPAMVGPVVSHGPVVSKIYLCGQAPGPHEGEIGKPFAWTAGKTLFRWLARTGVAEAEFRSLAYMAAVCRCFPGKNPKGGDRVPSRLEIENCSQWMKDEFELMRPLLLIPVGKLAIELFLPGKKLTDAVGTLIQKEIFGTTCDIISLPHPSGASTWYKVEPGASLLNSSLELISRHKVWQEVFCLRQTCV